MTSVTIPIWRIVDLKYLGSEYASFHFQVAHAQIS